MQVRKAIGAAEVVGQDSTVYNGDKYLVMSGVPSTMAHISEPAPKKIVVFKRVNGAAEEYSRNSISNMQPNITRLVGEIRSQAARIKAMPPNTSPEYREAQIAALEDLRQQWETVRENHERHRRVIASSKRLVWIFEAENLEKTLVYGVPIEHVSGEIPQEVPKELESADLLLSEPKR